MTLVLDKVEVARALMKLIEGFPLMSDKATALHIPSQLSFTTLKNRAIHSLKISQSLSQETVLH